MIFLNCLNEALVQTDDKTRIDVSRSFVSGLPITGITVKPLVSGSAISVFNVKQERWYLDWAYGVAGDYLITVQATDGVETANKTFPIKIISASEDNLYSDDSTMFSIESELMRYIPAGKNSFKYAHREAQSRILNYLDRKRIWNIDGTPLTKNQINVDDAIVKWSLYETIYLIYTDLFISIGDKFAEKVAQYRDLRNNERDRASIRIDVNKNGTLEINENQDLKSFRMIRR